MATVVLHQPTDMNALPTSINFTGGGYSNPVFDLHNLNSYASFVGTFGGGGATYGTINHAWLDTPDFDHIPNLEISGLSFSFDAVDYSAFIADGKFNVLVFFMLGDDDVITGSFGNDGIKGYAGNDTMFGGPGAGSTPDGADLFNGGGGSDTVSYANAPAGLVAGLEDFNANTGAALGDSYVEVENLIGSAFNDILYGTAANNRLSGGGGNDTMVGKSGGDTFDGSAGSDTVAYDANFALLRADLLSPGTNTGDAAGDVYISIENLTGSSFNDLLLGDDAANVISGNLFPNLQSGVDQIFGRGGNDRLNGNDDNDRLDGGLGNDILNGGSGIDQMFGRAGNDIFFVDNVGDIVSEAGDSGIDTVQSSISFSLANTLRVIGDVERLTLAGTAANGTGNALANVISGNTVANVLAGGLGNDILNGGSGNDTLFGGAGIDTLTGAANADFFVFNTALSAAANRDIITDFSHVDDTLRLENTGIFAKLTALGALNPVYFRAGSAALDSNDFIVYNQATGVLSYDFNGNVAGGAVAFAILTNHPILAANDFVVI